MQVAIDAAMFNGANTEHVVFFVKLRPYLAGVRVTTAYSDYLANLERVVASADDAEGRMAIFDRYMQRQAQLAAEGKQARGWTTSALP